MNSTIVTITLRAVLGRGRTLLLLLLPGTLLVLAGALRLAGVSGTGMATQVLVLYGFGAVLPLVALIVGTGVLGSEIEDGTIVYLLAKPVPRSVITVTKLVVAAGLTTALTAVSVFVAGVTLTGLTGGMAVAAAVGTLAGSVTYCAVFLALSVTVRHGLAIGLAYVIVWEGLVASAADGAKLLSIKAWALSVSDAFTSSPALSAPVGPGMSIVLLSVVAVGAAVLANQGLRSLEVTGED